MDKQSLNTLYGRGHQWFLKRKISYANRLSQLQNFLEGDPFRKDFLFGSYIPNLSKETGLEKRIRKTKYAKYIRSVYVERQSFADALSASEKLFTERVEFKGNIRRLVMATVRVIESCFPQEDMSNSPKTKFEPMSLVDASKFLKSDTSSGYPYRVKKGKIIDRLIDDCNQYLEFGLPDPFLYPIMSSFRLQLREKGNEISVKTRVIYPYPGSLTLLELRFIRPFIDHFTNNDTFYVIGRNGEKIRDLLISRFKHEDVKLLASTDFSSYDQTLLNEVIWMAFFVLRTQLRLTKSDSDLFDKLIDYFCCSAVNSSLKKKDQHIFLKLHGIPSGSGFTNLIGSICHAILVAYYDPKLLGQSLICGDDNLLNITSINFNDYITTLKRDFHMVISKDKCKIFRSYKTIHFLGFVWKDFVRLVSPLAVINQSIYHTDFRVDLDPYEREVARSASVLLNGQNGKEIFEQIFPEIKHELDIGKDFLIDYLSYARPPTSKLLSNSLAKPKTLMSLRLHLNTGWFIR